jgi:hypothetical protein
MMAPIRCRAEATAMPTRCTLGGTIPAIRSHARGETGLSDDELVVLLMAAGMLH